MIHFTRYIGIDYSGAQTAATGLPGLRVYVADGGSPPVEARPPSPPPKHWTRASVTEWLATGLEVNAPALVSIDHAFSFPIAYFEEHRLTRDWDEFLDDFSQHWPTDDGKGTVRSIRNGKGAARSGRATWRRRTDIRARAKSVFHFGVPGEVATATHAGLPWLRRLRRRLGARVHIWPFDGWAIPAGRSAIVEVYPTLWRRMPTPPGLTPHQDDARVIAASLAEADRDGRLRAWRSPALSDDERRDAEIEGWILGLT